MSEAVKLSSYFLNLYAVPVAVVSSLILATGLFVFLQQKRSPTNCSFFFLCLCIGFWLYGISAVYCSRDPEIALRWYRWVTFLGVAHIAPMVYLFSVQWLKLYENQKRWVKGSFVLAALFYFTSVTTPFGIVKMREHFWGFYPEYGVAGRVFLVFFFASFLAAFLNFFSALRKEADSLRKRQIGLITVAFLISVTGSVDYLPKISSWELYPFGYLCVLSWILMVAYSIVRYRMMDIETVIHKTIMWSIVSSVFTIPLILFSYFGKETLIDLQPISFTGIVIGLVILFGVYARYVQPAIDHLFQRRRWDLLRAYERFTDELVHLRDLGELTGHIVQTIKGIFYVQEMSLLLSKDEKGGFDCVKSVPEGTRLHVERSTAFFSWLERNDVLVVREYLELDPKYELIKDEARKYFESANGQLCLPLVVSGRLLGVINIGQKANLKPFGAAETNFLSDLRRTAAIALSNSLRSIQMQENLRRWNVELEKKVEERTKELKETQAQLVQAEKLASIGTLAGGIAHEINNPLTAVLTNAQMLKMSGEVEDKESLDLIEEGAKRCKTIIEKLMKYARKTVEVERFQEVDVNKVVETVCNFLEYQLKQENIEVIAAPSKVGPVSGIANELEQVLTNLILNSRDAIRDSGRKGRVEIKTDQQNGFVNVTISDNGVGIKKETLSRIFDPFYTTKDVGKGTGLGLTICAAIVEKHKGNISAASEEGRGASFTIQFLATKGEPLSGKNNEEEDLSCRR